MARPESKFMNSYSDDEIIDSFFESWIDGDSDDIKCLVPTRRLLA